MEEKNERLKYEQNISKKNIDSGWFEATKMVTHLGVFGEYLEQDFDRQLVSRLGLMFGLRTRTDNVCKLFVD